MPDKKQAVTPVEKPFLTGKPTDENTFRNALKFFGMMLIVLIMVFVICSMAGFQNSILRIAVNLLVEFLALYIIYTRGAGYGEEAVARGEILYQHQEKGIELTEKEKRIPFHPVKGFVTGVLGALIFLIPALILAVTAQRQMTGAGVLPSWMETYTRRAEIGNALVAYTNPEGLNFLDLVRIVVRIEIMPFINIVGAENKDTLLLLERLSPLLLLLPACAFGTGYLQGRKNRTRIHTAIAENAKKRKRRENKARKERIAKRTNGPQQLN